ncbi:MAG: radical SAM protein [Anaerolineae bacterium]
MNAEKGLGRQVGWDGLRPLPLEAGVVYGPIFSRRLGRSLGLNILPTQHKVCSLDCVYCHYGRTDLRTVHPPSTIFPTVHEILRSLEEALRQRPDLDCVTFSGNGEPTLHPYFRSVAFEVRRLLARLYPSAKVALFSNATTLSRSDVLEGLEYVDIPIMKLDAGDRETFARVNRPAPDVDFDTVVTGIANLPNAVVQSLFVSGSASNVTDEALASWMDKVAEIRPTAVQIYSIDYPVLSPDLSRVPPYMLRRIAEKVQAQTGVPAQAYWID